MYDVAIIGSGPAGLAAAVYCTRKGVDFKLITGTFGGKTTLSINFPDMSEYHVLKSKEQVQVYRAQIEYLSHTRCDGFADRVDELDDSFRVQVRDSDEQIDARYLIVATGARPDPLDVPGAAEFFGRSLGSSAISYSHLFRDKSICVVGNSDRAIDAAIECAEQAERVTLVLEPRALYSNGTLESAGRREEVTILNGYSVVAFEGDEWARAARVRRGGPDSASQPEREIVADAFFLERETHPNGEIVADLVMRDERGAIVVDARNRSSHPRIFAVGDVSTSGFEQVLIALGDGTRAAIAVYQELAASSVL
jgi:alkyl hydroperoxide reductase subunit F